MDERDERKRRTEMIDRDTELPFWVQVLLAFLVLFVLPILAEQI